MNLRKWRLQGAEVVILLTGIPDGDADAKRLHGAVLAFTKALRAETASPAEHPPSPRESK